MRGAESRPKSPKITEHAKINRCARGWSQVGRLGKKGRDLAGAKTPKINARGYQYRKKKKIRSSA